MYPSRLFKRSLLLVCFLLFGVGGAFAEPLPLRVGVAASNPPLAFMEDGRIVGVEADFANEFATFLGRPLEWHNMELSQLIPALLAEEVDIIMTGLSITESRALRVKYAQPYLRIGQMPLVRKTDRAHYADPLEFLNTKARVGMLDGSTGEALVRDNFVYAEKLPFLKIREAATALKRGDLDIVIVDSPIVWWLAANDSNLEAVPVELSEEFLAWAVRPEDTDLLESANLFLESRRVDGRLVETVRKWMPDSNW